MHSRMYVECMTGFFPDKPDRIIMIMMTMIMITICELQINFRKKTLSDIAL